MKNCSCVGCKFNAKYVVQNNWGAKASYTHFCAEHAPQWIREGKKESDPASLFGVHKSWYSLVDWKISHLNDVVAIVGYDNNPKNKPLIAIDEHGNKCFFHENQLQKITRNICEKRIKEVESYNGYGTEEKIKNLRRIIKNYVV